MFSFFQSFKKYKLFFLLLLLAFLFSELPLTSKVLACACKDGWYACENDTMCCQGHGCPSSYCEWGQGGVWKGGKCCTGQVCEDTDSCQTWGTKCKRVKYCDNMPDEPCWWETECETYCKKYVQSCYYSPCYAPDPGNKCSFCPVTPPEEECVVSPISPTLNSQTDKVAYITTENIHFSWSDPSWGKCCDSCANVGFDVYVDSVKIFSSGKGTLALDKLASTFTIGSHTWCVVAKNGNAGSVQSPVKNFTVSYPTGDVEGYIWDATGVGCVEPNKEGKEIQTSALVGGVSPTVDSVTGIWDTSMPDKSYTVSNVAPGSNKVLCASLPATQNKPGFKYNLACLNNSNSGVFSGSCAYIDVSSFPHRANLGYKLLSSGWFQVIGGDVYAGCNTCIDSVSMGIPITSEILGGFASSFVDGVGSLFANSDVSIKDSNGSTKVTSTEGNKYYSKNVNDGNMWPEGFSFTPILDAQETTPNCRIIFSNGSLNPRNVYKADSNCIQTGLDFLSGNYRLAKDGVVVIYVTGGGNLAFTKNFISESSSKRVIFIHEGSVEISSAIGEIAPTTSTAPNIQASIIAKDSIDFLNKGSSDDTTIIVEGPLVSKDGNVDFSRDRGLANAYPGIVVKYNPLYMTALNSGIGEVSVIWSVNN